jgi:NADPH-dependent 2,4-dienoyl-CoA reductase/sulfur reductase-like enzyme
MSFRSGEGAGEPNALSRHIGLPPRGEPLVAGVLVVGAGPAGREASASARGAGAPTILVDARALEGREVRSPCPAGVADDKLSVLERGFSRPVHAGAIVLANGARDQSPRFPGATLAGVLPLDLLERYQALGHEIGSSFHVATSPLEIESASGAARVERARIRGKETEVDLVFVRFRREPELSLAKALGCRTVYDRELSLTRLAVGDEGETSVPGIFAAGDVVGTPSLEKALEAGRRAGRAAARFALRSS